MNKIILAIVFCGAIIFIGCGESPPKQGEIWENCPFGSNPFKRCRQYEVLQTEGRYVQYAPVGGGYIDSCDMLFFVLRNDRVE